MLASFGTIVAVLFYMVSVLSNDPRTFMPFIFIGATIRGAFGKSAITTMALHSYVTDTTSKEQRTSKLGRLLAMNFFGFFTGSLLAGALLDVSSFDVVFCTVVFVNSLCVIITVLFMKESVPGVTTILPKTPEVEQAPDMPPKKKAKHPFTWANIKDSLAVLIEPRANGARMHLIVLFVVIIIQQACKSGEVDVTLLFVERSPLRWRKALYGYLLATDYACLGVAVLLLLPLLIRFVRLDDATLVLIGIAFKVVRLLIMAFSTHTWMVFLSVVAGCPSAMIISGVKSLISKSVREDEVGKAFSLLSCGETLSSFFGSIIFINLYAETLVLFPGFTFTIDAAFFAIMFICLVFLARELNAGVKRRELNDLLATDNQPDYGTTTTTEATKEDEEEEDTSEGIVPSSSRELLIPQD
jgi:PCFT/HCP family folate transporter-like MFS transporter 1/3